MYLHKRHVKMATVLFLALQRDVCGGKEERQNKFCHKIEIGPTAERGSVNIAERNIR